MQSTTDGSGEGVVGAGSISCPMNGISLTARPRRPRPNDRLPFAAYALGHIPDRFVIQQRKQVVIATSIQTCIDRTFICFFTEVCLDGSRAHFEQRLKQGLIPRHCLGASEVECVPEPVTMGDGVVRFLPHKFMFQRSLSKSQLRMN